MVLVLLVIHVEEGKEFGSLPHTKRKSIPALYVKGKTLTLKKKEYFYDFVFIKQLPKNALIPEKIDTFNYMKNEKICVLKDSL